MKKRMIGYTSVLLLMLTLSWMTTALAEEGDLFLPLIVRNSSSGTVPTPTPSPTVTPTVTPTPTLPPAIAWPVITLTPLANGFDQPIHVTHAGDGSGRIFVVERAGTIQILENGQKLAAPFLNIIDRVECCASELGLFSMAFPPDFETDAHFYVSYTAKVDDQVTSRISRFGLTADVNVADPGSEQIVLEFEQPENNHNGGQISFGPDGYLYISTGDGGSGGDPWNNGQTLSTLLGKLLRIDVESGDPVTYTIPADNPFVGNSAARGEIWAYGLRNPWRFSFDRQTGDLYIGDVGQGEWEEIDFQPADSPGGENYGWKIMEGPECYNANSCDQSGLVLPVASYGRNLGQSITGGMVYRGSQFPGMGGIYFYADYQTGRIFGLRRVNNEWQTTEFTNSPYNIASFGEDEAGEIYIVDLGGAVYQIRQ
jgi:glucose/arabinose dehydrogenase